MQGLSPQANTPTRIRTTPEWMWQMVLWNQSVLCECKHEQLLDPHADALAAMTHTVRTVLL